MRNLQVLTTDSEFDLDPEPTLDEMIGQASRDVVAKGRLLGDDDSRIRFEVRTAVEIALGDTPMKELMVMGDEGAEFSSPALYRLVLNFMDVDRHDLHAQEHVYQVALAACNEALIELAGEPQSG